MRINYNVSSIIAKNAMNNNDKRVAASTKRLSSGYKINSSADNAAGLAIARRMNAQIKSLQEANQSANDGLSALNTADGAMAEIHDILQRMNELAIQSANGTNADSDREMIQKEIDQLVSEIDRIAETTEFNSQNLLDGSFALKAYANIDNVKVMSHTDGVATGTYVIGQLTYYHYEDMTTRYTTEETKIKDSAGKVTNVSYASQAVQVIEKERYEVNNDKNFLADNLVTSSSISQYNHINQIKAFPQGSKVTVEDENIVIKAQGNFEMKIAVNDRTPIDDDKNLEEKYSPAGADPNTDPVDSITRTYKKAAAGATVVTTTSFSSVKNYRNIAVSGPDGKRYNISELNFFQNVQSDGKTPATSGANAEFYTDYRGDSCNGLKDDFAEYFKAANPKCSIEINDVKWDGNDKFTISYTATDEKTGAKTVYDSGAAPNQPAIEFTLYKDTNEYGSVMANQKKLDDFLYTETVTTRTEYKIGDKDDPKNSLKIDVTGMGPMIVQVGANAGQYMELEIPALRTENLGVDKIDITTEESARLAIDDVSDAIVQLSAIRSRIGAYSNRLEHTITNLDTTEENITASYSRIMDVDMAAEMTEYSTVQVLVQASTSMLAQANERPQQVLQLLQ